MNYNFCADVFLIQKCTHNFVELTEKVRLTLLRLFPHQLPLNGYIYSVDDTQRFDFDTGRLAKPAQCPQDPVLPSGPPRSQGPERLRAVNFAQAKSRRGQLSHLHSGKPVTLLPLALYKS